MISFMKKDEQRVKLAFKDFNLERTNLELQYATVKANRWENYLLWANTDIPMIKRVKKWIVSIKYLTIKNHLRLTLLPPDISYADA